MAHSQTIIRFTFLLLLSIPVQAYAQDAHFEVDVKNAPAWPYLQSKRVMVVNNTVCQPQGFGHIVASEGKQQTPDTIDLEQASLQHLFTLVRALDLSDEFDNISLLERSQNTSGYFKMRQSLTAAQADSLCQRYAVDELLILNQLVLYDLQEVFSLRQAKGAFAYLECYSQAHWSLHTAFSNQPDRVFSTTDTLVWESDYQPTLDSALAHLPDKQEALLYLAEYSAEQMAGRLLPSWERQTRYLYGTNDPALKAGFEAFARQQWEQAIQVWQEVMEGGKKKTAAYAAADCAIAWEMLGDLDRALTCVHRAVSLFGDCSSPDGRQQIYNLRYYQGLLQAQKAMPTAR